MEIRNFEAAMFDTGRVYTAPDLKEALRHISREKTENAMVLDNQKNLTPVWQGSSRDALLTLSAM